MCILQCFGPCVIFAGHLTLCARLKQGKYTCVHEYYWYSKWYCTLSLMLSLLNLSAMPATSAATKKFCLCFFLLTVDLFLFFYREVRYECLEGTEHCYFQNLKNNHIMAKKKTEGL